MAGLFSLPSRCQYQGARCPGRLLLIAFFLCSSCLYPYHSFVIAGEQNQDELERLLERVEERASGTRTVQCLFRQERTLTIFAKPVLFEGRMFLSRPDKLRWENTDPIPSALVFSGNSGLRCNDDAAPVHFNLQTDPVMKMVAEQIWTWADGNYEKLRNKFSIRLAGDHTIQLKPVEKAAEVIQAVTVTFAEQTLQPVTVEVLEKEGDSTRISFYDYVLNQPIDNALFTSCSP